MNESANDDYQPNTVYDPRFDPGDGYEDNEPQKRSSRNCLVFGCLLPILGVVVLLIVATIVGIRFVKTQVNRYTAEQAVELPKVELPAEELAEIRGRIDTFRDTLAAGEAPPDALVLTADEINALIQQQDDLKGRIFVKIQDGQVSGDVSIPTDFLPGGAGRFFNASATFNVLLMDGKLIVTLVAAEVQGTPVPQEVVDNIRQHNLAQDAHNDPELAAVLKKFSSLEIVDDRIILMPRGGLQEPAASPAAPAAGAAEPAADGP